MNQVLQELESSLLNDLKTLGIEQGFKLKLKPFSSRLMGKYSTSTNSIFLYAYQDKIGEVLYPYEEILETLIHEVTHYLQWQKPNYFRCKGIMHDHEFTVTYNELMTVARKKGLISEKCSN